MAGYIGNQPVQAYSAGTQKDIFVPDGTVRRFAFQFNKPQLQASDVILVVNNVIQNPGSTYDLIDLYEVLLTGLTGGTFVVGSTVTSGANSGVVVVSEGSRIFVEMTTGLFAPGNVLTSGAVSGTVESSTFQDNRGLKFASAPLVTDEIYAITSGLPTIFALPPDGSITAEKLSADLKRIEVDKFTATAGQTQIILSRTPATADSVLVFVNGVFQTSGLNYTLLGTNLTFTEGLQLDDKVQVVYQVFAGTSQTNADFVAIDDGVGGANYQTVQEYNEYLKSESGASDLGYTPAGTGAVATTVETKLRESASVADYGASPSASASANKAAFIAATTEAERVSVPTGDYILESFDMPANTILYGEGMGSSRLFFTTGNAGSNDCINMGQNCELRDLYMSPQTKTSSYSVLPLLVPEAVFSYNPNIDAPRLALNCKAVGCFFDGFNNGIASDSDNVTVDKCVSKGGNSALVFFDSDGFSITASVFYGGIFGGVALPSCKNGVVIGNRLIMPGSTGVNPGGSSAAGFNVANLTISDNVIIGTNGVTCELGIEGVTISNNVILIANPVSTDGVGIGVATRNGGGKLSNIVITGNTIRPLNPAQSYAFGINVANDDPAGPNLSLDNVTITGNSIVGASSGIIVQALISFVVGATVSSNKITGGRFGLYFIACRRVTAIGNVMEADGPGTLSNYYGILFGSCTDSIFAENIIKGYGVHFYQTGDDTSNVRLLCNTNLPNDDLGAFVELQNTSAIAPDSMLRYSEAIPAAFAVFDGSGAVGAITPLQQKGVLSVSKIATGQYTVTLERAFISSTPIVLPSAGNTTGVTGAAAAVENISASSFDIRVFLTTTGAPSDLNRVGFTVIGS